eukprot:738937_1
MGSCCSGDTQHVHNLVYVIGSNLIGGLGLGHGHDVEELTLLTDLYDINADIVFIHTGSAFEIFADRTQNYWAAGHNSAGCCFIKLTDTFSWNIVPITFFSSQNTKIRKLFTNHTSNTTFCLCSNNELYTMGANNNYQMGIGHKQTLTEPVSIDTLQNVYDIQPSGQYTLALCSNINVYVIVTFWCMELSDNVATLIERYCDLQYSVYCAGYDDYGAMGYGRIQLHEWTKVTFFDDKHVTQISVGQNHALFLESNGALWSAGTVNAKRDESFENVSLPTRICEKMRIEKVKCGTYHCLALNDDGGLYAWGMNTWGQCALGQSDCVDTPTMIHELKKYFVLGIECGTYHSYAVTMECDHFLWGSNKYNECLTYDGNNKIQKPNRINERFAMDTKGREIQFVSLGFHTTKFIVS